MTWLWWVAHSDLLRLSLIDSGRLDAFVCVKVVARVSNEQLVFGWIPDVARMNNIVHLVA